MSNSKLTMTFLGVGSAFAKANYQNSLLLESADDNILIDCGATAPRSLWEMKKSIVDVNNIFITHLHADHTGGLEEAAFMSYFAGRPGKRKKYQELKNALEKTEEWANVSKRAALDWKPTLISTINILNNLWDSSLKGGLNSIQYQLTQLHDYFNIETLVHNDKKHAGFSHCGVRFELVRVDHVYIEKKFDVPCYGLLMEKADTGKKVLFTGDTKFDWDTFQWLFSYADTIFHDCQLFDSPASIHASYNELKGLPETIKAKMWLMHYGDNFSQFDPQKDGFKGFVKQQVPMNFDEV